MLYVGKLAIKDLMLCLAKSASNDFKQHLGEFADNSIRLYLVQLAGSKIMPSLGELSDNDPPHTHTRAHKGRENKRTQGA